MTITLYKRVVEPTLLQIRTLILAVTTLFNKRTKIRKPAPTTAPQADARASRSTIIKFKARQRKLTLTLGSDKFWSF